MNIVYNVLTTEELLRVASAERTTNQLLDEVCKRLEQELDTDHTFDESGYFADRDNVEVS